MLEDSHSEADLKPREKMTDKVSRCVVVWSEMEWEGHLKGKTMLA